MDQITIFSIFKKPPLLPFLVIITITFFFFLPKTQSISSNYTSCPPQDCGNGLPIKYPFWITNLQEPSCGNGSPHFNITCRNKNPILKLSNDDYIIQQINYTDNSVLLVQHEVFESKCPLPQHNFTLEGTLFHKGPNTTNLCLFYNCSVHYNTNESYPIECTKWKNSFALFHTIPDSYSNERCLTTIKILVSSDSIDDTLSKKNYIDVLKMGFVLKWDGIDCEICNRSGGHCRSDDNANFTCFCKDGTNRSYCIAEWTPRRSNIGLVKIGIGFGAAGGTAIVLCLIFILYQRNRNNKIKTEPVSISRYSSSYPSSSATGYEDSRILFGVHVFTYEDIEKATNKFDPNNVLGDGGFGTVYKGKLKDGRYIAVKRMYENNLRMVEQFMNEIDMLTRLHHRNLVTLYGCTSRHSRELLLVYEYISNGTVADHLHGPLAKPGLLPWITRMSIATETASALAFLHASDVIHRDVKTNNILLDENFSVKVADFGLSRLFPTHVTHISTAPQGTPGYVDPEYHQCYHLTDKSDVYSFGVVLIELISSKPAVDISRHRHEINLSNMALDKIQKDALHELVDPELGYDTDNTVKTMIDVVAELSFQCLQSQRDMRPSMEEVFKALLYLQSKDSPDTVMIDVTSRSTTSSTVSS